MILPIWTDHFSVGFLEGGVWELALEMSMVFGEAMVASGAELRMEQVRCWVVWWQSLLKNN